MYCDLPLYILWSTTLRIVICHPTYCDLYLMWWYQFPVWCKSLKRGHYLYVLFTSHWLYKCATNSSTKCSHNVNTLVYTASIRRENNHICRSFLSKNMQIYKIAITSRCKQMKCIIWHWGTAIFVTFVLVSDVRFKFIHSLLSLLTARYHHVNLCSLPTGVIVDDTYTSWVWSTFPVC